MRRWNGWGDDATIATLNPQASAMLAELAGKPVAAQPVDASHDHFLTAVPASRLPAHPLITTDAAERFKVALGESFPDLLRRRCGTVPPMPDGVAFPETSAQVRELLDAAQTNNWIVIPFAGGTSVAGHLDCPVSERSVLSINLTRMNRLLHLDTQSQLATFGAGTPGPLVEAQLRAQGYTLGHFPQSFEYSTVGGWVVTRSSGQQSLRYGRIEQMFAGGKLEAPIGTMVIPTFPASSAGPDLREMVLGSEARLGVLTEVTVRVTKLAEHESFHAIFLPDWDAAEAAVRGLVQMKLPLSMLRLSNANESFTNLSMAGHAGFIGWIERYLAWRGCGDGKCWLTVGITGDERTTANALKVARAHLSNFGAVYVPVLGPKWAENRFKGPYMRNALWEHGYSADTIETAVDWPQVKNLMNAMEQAARDAFGTYGEKVHAFTHLSHLYPQGSSIYSTFVWATAPGGFAPNHERWLRYKTAVSAAILAHGGTASHQHGIGRDHAANMAMEKGPIAMNALMQLCRYFDPKRIMNPGKLLTDLGQGEQWLN